MKEDFLATQVAGFFTEADLFDQVNDLDGEVYRQIDDRKTLKVTLGSHSYFAKIHHGVGWGEIFKNLLQGRLPVLGARNEWLALRALNRVQVPTMTPVLYCERGLNPARRRSVILTEALESKITLEDFQTADPVLKRNIIREVALVARGMHQAGINHRDFYLCHFLMDLHADDAINLHLIDLHRAQIRTRVPDRWLVKDLGGLLFSAFDKNLTRRDLLRFVRTYCDQPLRISLARDAVFWSRVVDRACRLYLQDHDAVPDAIQRLIAR